MKDSVTKAVNESVGKWEKIEEGTGLDQGARNCSLCQMFGLNGCRGCPVMFKTSLKGCIGTPLDEWTTHHDKKHEPFLDGKNVQCAECREIAGKEIDFLKSLLVEESKIEPEEGEVYKVGCGYVLIFRDWDSKELRGVYEDGSGHRGNALRHVAEGRFGARKVFSVREHKEGEKCE